MNAMARIMAGDSDRLATLQDETMRDLATRMRKVELWQSAHEVLCGFRWKVLLRVAVLGFVWLTVLVIGLRAPVVDLLLKTLLP